MKQAKIWRLGRRLFMVVTTGDDFDPEQASADHRASHPRVLEWEEMMDTFQEPVPESDGTGTWAEMRKIFTLVQD
jgi:L-rhamnose mutarotase